MQLGIFAKTFEGRDPFSVLSAARDAGYRSVQYNFACSGLPSMPVAVSEEVLEDIAVARSRTGIEIVALSATYNMIHPDRAVRAAGLVGLGIAIRAAADLSIPMVTLCTGTRDPEDQWRAHPDNSTEAAWKDLLTEMARAAALAEAHGVALGIEPEQANVVRNADDALRLLSEIPSPRLRVVLDPANLFEPDEADRASDIVAEAISKLGPHIGMAHAKDKLRDGQVCAAGRGIIDFPAMLRQLRAAGFDGPLITHGLHAGEAAGVARYLGGLIA